MPGRVLLLPLFAGLLLLAGCSDDDGGDASESLRAALDATLEAGTARATVQIDLTGLAAGVGDVEPSGVVDFAGERAEMSIDLGTIGGGGTMTLRFVGSDLFLRSAAFQGTAGVDADTWLRVDTQAEGGQGLGELGAAGNGDPRQGLAVLEGIVDGAAEEIGDEEVDGTATTQYRTRVDPASISGPASVGEDSVLVDVWVDDDDLVRRVRFPIQLAEEAGGDRLEVTVTYADFGVEADIGDPDPAEVRDLQDIIDQLR